MAGIDRSYGGGDGDGGDGGGGGSSVSFGDEEAAQGRQPRFKTEEGQTPTSSPDAAASGIGAGAGAGAGNDGGGTGSIGGRAHTALDAMAAEEAAAAAAAPVGPAGLRRAVTTTAAEGGAEEQQQQQPQQQQPRQGPRSTPLLPARHGVATAGARPETSGHTTRPAAAAAVSAASGLPRRRGSGGPLTRGGGGSRTGGCVGRFKNSKLRGSGVRVLMPGEGARDYSSLLKGSGSVRGRELEARVATAEAEVGTVGARGGVPNVGHAHSARNNHQT